MLIYFLFSDLDVICYTDASDKLVDRVEIDQIHFDNKNLMVVYELDLENYVGQYWCYEQISKIKSNTVIAYKKIGNDFALGIKMYNACWRFKICKDQNPIEKIIDYMEDWIGTNVIREIRIMELRNNSQSNIADGFLEITAHLTTNTESSQLQDLMRDYKTIKMALHQTPHGTETIFFRSSLYCLPENTTAFNKLLSWPLTKVNHKALPNAICISENGVPQARTCDGNFTVGAFWSEKTPECSDTTLISNKTQLLTSLVNKPMSNTTALRISELTENASNLTSYDLYNVKKALDKMYDLIKLGNHMYIEDIVKIVSNLMLSNNETVREAENLLDCPSELLHTFEEAVEDGELTYSEAGLLNIKEKNVAVEWVKPYINNISNFVVSNGDAGTIDIINFNTSAAVQDLMQETSSRLIVVIPDSILNATTLTEIDKSNITIGITAFSGSNLFASNNTNLTVISEIVGVSVSKYRSYLPEPITVYFRSNATVGANICAYWDYGDRIQGKRADWSTVGSTYVGQLYNSSFVECSFSHLTHFALLIVNDLNFAQESQAVVNNISVSEVKKDSHLFKLELITAIGTTMSLIGLLLVLLTAVIFKKWRKLPGTKILLQLTVVIVLEIILFQMAELKSLDSAVLCSVVGILLHYIILSKLCWMLVFAFLQYNRFVKIFSVLPERIVLKSSLFGWGVPLIPVGITTAIAKDSYIAGSQGFCYPKGLAMYLGIFFPVVVIVLINLSALCYIMYQILQSNNIKIRSTNYSSQRFQVYIAILLFFMLGIPWLFGILAEVFVNTCLFWVFVYLFCLTATLQGFVLCLFYIIMNKDVRNMWITFFKPK